MGLVLVSKLVLVPLLIGAIAPVLGPRRSGLLTVLPVAATILAVFSHRNAGGPFAVDLLRGLAIGLYSLTAFFATLALGLEPLGIARAFGLALLASPAARVGVLMAVEGRRDPLSWARGSR